MPNLSFSLCIAKSTGQTANLEASHFPNMDYCLCIPEGSGIILENALSKRTSSVYPITEHHMNLLKVH